MPQLYLGTNTIAGVYLGTQNVCDVFVGTAQGFDNCVYTPSTLTLLYQSSYGGNRNNLITDNPSDGSTLSGQPGTTGTFSISSPSWPSDGSSPSDYEGYPTATDFPTLSSTSNITATFPTSGNLNVTGPTKSGGLNTIPSSTTRVDTLNVSSGLGGSGAGTATFTAPASGSSITHTGTEGGTYTVAVSFTGVASYTYANLQVNSVAMSGSGIGPYTASWSNTFGASNNTHNYSVTGDAPVPTQYTHSFTFDRSGIVTGAGTTLNDINSTWSVSGSNIISGTTNGTFPGASSSESSGSIVYTGSISASFSNTASSGFSLTGGQYEIGSVPISLPYTPSTTSSSTQIDFDGATANIVVNSSSWINQGGSPFSTQLAACTAANSATSGNATVYYTGSIESGLLYTGSNLSGQLSGGWYYDWSAGEVGYYTFGSGWSGYGGC